MAANALRLRRSLALTSSIFNHPKNFSSVLPSVAPTSSPHTIQQNPNTFDVNQSKLSFQFISSRAFSSRPRSNNLDTGGDQINPDDVLFEGCDYEHWLITMDFPKDPKPSPEEMVETYVQTAAKVLGSVEEAKKKIYACSTTIYHGFQIQVSEEVSEQFQGLPGVVFILPDSYIDPVNKEYGGDKYINGTIIPRPPPPQYGRQGGRYSDRNRDYNRPPRGGMGQNGPPGGQGDYAGDRRGPMPYQSNYNQGDGRNVDPSKQVDYPQMDPRNSTFKQPERGYNQGGGGSYRQGTEGRYGQGGGSGGYGGQYGQPGGGSYNQAAGGQYGQGGGGGGNYGQGSTGQNGQGGGGGNYVQGGTGQYGQGGGGGNYGQGGTGQYGQGGGTGQYEQGGGGGQFGQGGGGGGGQYGQGGRGGYGQGIGSGGGLSSSQYGEDPRFSQADRRRDIPGQQGNYEVVE